jgi:hypothetical protein
MFSRDIENNVRPLEKQHLPSNLVEEIHKHSRDGFKSSQQIVLPPVNSHAGWIRSKPMSAFSGNTIISSNGQVDFSLGSAGFCEKLYLECELTVSTAAVSILPHHLIDRIEYLSTEGNIIQTQYGELVFLQKLHESREKFLRANASEFLDNFYEPVSKAVGSYRFLIKIPSITDGNHLKLNAIKDRLLVRIYFSTFGITAGSVANVTINSLDILQKTIALSGPLESLEIHRKSSQKLSFRTLNPVRVTESMQMNANNIYNVRLTSFNNMSAYMFFILRAAPITTNASQYIACDKFELLDCDNNIVGIQHNNEIVDNVIKQHLPSDITNYPSKQVYFIPFCIDVESAKNGNQVGFYKFTGQEQLRIYTGAVWTNQVVRVDVFSFDYTTLRMCHGRLDISK